MSGLLEALGKMPGLFPADPGEIASFTGQHTLTMKNTISNCYVLFLKTF